MKSYIAQNFSGYINGVEIPDESIYHTMVYLLDNMEERFGINSEKVFKPLFIEDLFNVIDTIYMKYDDITTHDIEEAFYDSFYAVTRVKDIQILIDGQDWKFEWFNRRLKDGTYFIQ